MTDRWVPDPRLSDGPEGRGESGPADTLASRRETEVAATTGRFPGHDGLVDPSNPIEPDDDEPPESDVARATPGSPAADW